MIRFCIYFYSVGGGGLLPEFTNIFNICTTLDPTTTIKKNAINHLLTGSSSFFFSSEVLPSVTVPRLVMFLSNFLFLLAIALGIGCHLQLVNRHNRLRMVGVCVRDISILSVDGRTCIARNFNLPCFLVTFASKIGMVVS